MYDINIEGKKERKTEKKIWLIISDTIQADAQCDVHDALPEKGETLCPVLYAKAESVLGGFCIGTKYVHHHMILLQSL